MNSPPQRITYGYFTTTNETLLTLEAKILEREMNGIIFKFLANPTGSLFIGFFNPSVVAVSFVVSGKNFWLDAYSILKQITETAQASDNMSGFEHPRS